MDGLEVTRRIRRTVGDDIPVIILTAYDWSEIESEAREAGMNEHFAKPIDVRKLEVLLHSYLLGAEAAEEI